jgi:hypothetical protein
MKLRERNSNRKVCSKQKEELEKGNVVSLLKKKNIKKVTVKKVTEKYILDDQLPEARLELGQKTNVIRMLNDLSAPLYMHILTLELCKMVQLIRPHVKEKDRKDVAYKAYQVIKEIKKSRPKWIFHQNPRAEYSLKRKSLTDGQIYNRELLKIKNCRDTCRIVIKINVNISFSQNSCVLEELRQVQETNQERAPRWVFAYKIPTPAVIRDLEVEFKQKITKS